MRHPNATSPSSRSFLASSAAPRSSESHTEYAFRRGPVVIEVLLVGMVVLIAILLCGAILMYTIGYQIVRPMEDEIIRLQAQQSQHTDQIDRLERALDQYIPRHGQDLRPHQRVGSPYRKV